MLGAPALGSCAESARQRWPTTKVVSQCFMSFASIVAFQTGCRLY